MQVHGVGASDSVGCSREADLDGRVEWERDDAVGRHEVLWGLCPTQDLK